MQIELNSLVRDVVVNYLRNHQLPPDDLPTLIQTVYNSLQQVGSHEMGSESTAKPTPAVPIAKSKHAKHLVCLECGAKVQMLRRHIAKRHGLTPDDYRSKWSLPPGYPMVAPDFSKRRAELAQASAFGRR